MAAFPERFTSATRDEQFRIIDLGILLLDLITEQQPAPQNESSEQDQKIMKLLEELAEEKETAVKQATMAVKALAQDELYQLKIENARLQARQEMHSFSTEALRLLQDEIQRKNQQLEEAAQNTNKSSQQIGKQGEKEVETLFSEFVHADIINMAAIGHSGDFHIRVDNGAGAESVFLVDSKKYATSVPKSEREKITRDVDEDSTIAGGLLISLNSTIQNRHHFQVDTTENKKPIMYLCLKDMSYEESGRSIAAAIRILNTIAITHDQDEKDNLLKKIQAVSKELSQRIQEATNVITSMGKLLDAQTKLRDKLKKNLLGIQMEDAITKPATLDSFVTIVPPEPELQAVPEPVKKTRGRKPKPA
jgi:hypothetical protein